MSEKYSIEHGPPCECSQQGYSEHWPRNRYCPLGREEEREAEIAADRREAQRILRVFGVYFRTTKGNEHEWGRRILRAALGDESIPNIENIT